MECGRQRGRLASKDYLYPHLGDQPQREVRSSSYLKAIREEGEKKKKNVCYCATYLAANLSVEPHRRPSLPLVPHSDVTMTPEFREMCPG